MKLSKLLLTILLLFTIVTNLLSAEKIGGLSGWITDKETKKPITGVAVMVEDSIRYISDEKGRYIIHNIPIGSYQITFNRLGYKTQTKTNIFVKPNRNTILNVSLHLEAIKMSGITVKNKQFFIEIPDAPVSSKNLDVEEIRLQPSGTYDIQRAIQALPAVVSGSDTENEIIVRGGNYGENLFVIDNIELSNPNHFAWQGSGGGPICILSPEFIKEIDFYAGAFPSKYGDKASSVLDITTRNGNENRFEAKLDIGMAGYGGNIEGPFPAKSGSYIFSYHRSFLSLVSESFGLTAVPNYHSIFAKQVINISSTQKLTLNQIWANDWIDIKHEESTYTQGAGDEDIYAKSGQYAIGATLRSIFKNSYSLLTLYRNYNWWHIDIYEANKKVADHRVFYNHSYEAHNTLKFDLNFPKTRIGKLSFGLNLKNVETKDERFMKPDTVFVYEYPVVDSIIVDTIIVDTLNIYSYGPDNKIDADINAFKIGSFIQWKNNFGLLNINVGFRYDYFTYSEQEGIAPRLGLKYTLSENSSLNFGLGRHYQNPEYYQLTFDERNKVLKPKFTDQIILGFEQLLSEDIKASVETYYKKYKDVPINYAMTTAEPNDRDTYFVNVGKGYAKGIEFFLQKKVKDDFWGTLSYSYSVAKAKDPRDSTGKKEFDWDFDYRQVFTGVLGYKIEFMKYNWYEQASKWLRYFAWTCLVPSDETEISIKFRYLGGKPYTEQTYIDSLRRWRILPDKDINDKRFPPYKRFDLHIHHRWFFDKLNIVSYLEIDNLFNTKNIWDYAYREDGTKEKVYQWGRMIVGGVMIEF
ncbi:MAG: TonB-dependent receptor [Candidatus Cloacimonetes bacterium]|nr:TonB-dependent receptor [Candidatus Cloacimonadota bacterium]